MTPDYCPQKTLKISLQSSTLLSFHRELFSHNLQLLSQELAAPALLADLRRHFQTAYSELFEQTAILMFGFFQSPLGVREAIEMGVRLTLEFLDGGDKVELALLSLGDFELALGGMIGLLLGLDKEQLDLLVLFVELHLDVENVLFEFCVLQLQLVRIAQHLLDVHRSADYNNAQIKAASPLTKYHYMRIILLLPMPHSTLFYRALWVMYRFSLRAFLSYADPSNRLFACSLSASSWLVLCFR